MTGRSAAALHLAACLAGGCAVGGPGSHGSREDLPCIPNETRCESVDLMTVCAADGLSREAVVCAEDEVCLTSLPGGRCERAPANVRTLRQTFDATLRLELPAGGACTGFLVNDRIAVTNHHCCEDWEACVEGGVVALARHRGEGHEAAFSAIAVGAELPELDAVALELEGSPGTTYGHVAFARGRAWTGSNVHVTGHPGGRSLESSLGILYDYESSVTYRYRTTTRTKRFQVLYGARAEPGSSGSPVFLLGTHALVALHHSGGLRPEDFGLTEHATDGFDELLAGTDSEALADALEAHGVRIESLRP